MNKELLLLILWTGFALLHSMLAATWFKKIMQKLLKKQFVYYRFLYSSFALLSLIIVMYYYFSIQSALVWQPPLAEKIAGIITGLAGLIIMLICARIYFAEMMGLYAFAKKTENIGLVQTGLHKYMRHPLYTGTLLFMWAFFIYQPSVKNIVTCGANTIYVLIGIHLEERKLITSFGDAYRKYAAKTPMLIPGLK